MARLSKHTALQELFNVQDLLPSSATVIHEQALIHLQVYILN